MSRCFRPLLLLGFCLAAGAKTVITHETLWLMKRVARPAPSPDGKWVVFAVTDPSYDPQKQTSDLWIVPTDGSGKPRQLTFTKGSEGDIAWSPDGKRIAFTARREGDEASQVYVLEIGAGGEARRVTSLTAGADSPKWSPDGRSLLMHTMAYPGAADDDANRRAAAESKSRKYNARVYTAFPIRYWDRWLDERQPALVAQAAEDGARPKYLLAGSRLVQEAGFGGSLAESGESLRAIWSPDGKSVVFAAKTDRHQEAFSNSRNRLFVVPAGGGEPVAVTSEDGAYGDLSFSADGRTLYAAFDPNTEFAYNLARLVRFEWKDGRPVERKVLTSGFDRSVDSYLPAKDGRSILLLVEEASHTKVYSIDARGGPARKLIDTPLGMYSDLGWGGTSLVAIWQSAVNPPEVVRIDPATGKHANLTAFTAEKTEDLDWLPARHFTFTSTRGKSIHNLLVLPPAFDEKRKYPLFVLMHGGPHNMWRDQFFLRWNYHLLASPGYVLLLTDYSGSTGYGEKFSQSIQGDPLEGPANEINEAADEAIRRFAFIDGTRQAAGGASYGGHLANWMQASTTRYKCLISHAGLVSLESQWGTSDVIYHREVNSEGPVWEQGRVWREQSPARRAKSFKTPILVTVGERDYRVPLNNSIENWSLLKRLQVPSKLIVFPEENHWIMRGENSRFFYEQVLGWLKTHL